MWKLPIKYWLTALTVLKVIFKIFNRSLCLLNEFYYLNITLLIFSVTKKAHSVISLWTFPLTWLVQLLQLQSASQICISVITCDISSYLLSSQSVYHEKETFFFIKVLKTEEKNCIRCRRTAARCRFLFLHNIKIRTLVPSQDHHHCWSQASFNAA